MGYIPLIIVSLRSIIREHNLPFLNPLQFGEMTSQNSVNEHVGVD